MAVNPGSPGGTDTFLHLQAKRAGKVKGEATTAGHVDDIVVAGWHWGLTAAMALGDTRATGRRSYTALTVNKHVDLATTALMSALATNDEIKEAKLTMRRAGGLQEPFLIITLKSARIASVQHDSGGDGDTRETLAIVFTDVEVEYRKQGASGGRGASTVFTDSVSNTV
jgi:type VI secretion system secreted protein Hcp